MSTKTETKQVNAYNPTSMSAFNTLTPGFASSVKEGMQGTKFQNLILSELLRGSDTSSQAEIQNLMRNRAFTGFGGASMNPYMASQLARQQRGTSSRRAQAQIQSRLLSEQLKQYYTQLAGGYRPLQTGGTQTTSKSGLGTWLPKVAGAGLAGLATVLSGGLASPLLAGALGAGSAAGASFLSSSPSYMGGAANTPAPAGWDNNSWLSDPYSPSSSLTKLY